MFLLVVICLNLNLAKTSGASFEIFLYLYFPQTAEVVCIDNKNCPSDTACFYSNLIFFKKQN